MFELTVKFSISLEYPEVVDQLIVMNCPHGGAMKKAWMSGTKQVLASSYMFFFQVATY